MLFDLSDLIQMHNTLESLEAKFTTEEIDGIVRKLPNDKSPSPDGFNNEFIKNVGAILRMTFMNCVGLFRITVTAFKVSTHLLSLWFPKFRALPVCLNIDLSPLTSP
jgi:hypothetical protein